MAIVLLPFQAFAITTLGSLTLTAVKCRILRPTAIYATIRRDSNLIILNFCPSAGLSTIFPAHGGRTEGGTDPTTVLLWDGKDSDVRLWLAVYYL